MRRAVLIVLAGLVAAACGGGGGTVAFGPSDGGIGSGGTGAVAVLASGPVQGFGSIIVNGTRYETDTARLDLRDAAQLKLGMTVQVAGTVSTDLAAGIATTVTSAARLRGPLTDKDAAAGRFSLLGVTVQVDAATVVASAGGLAALAENTTVQVWGLPQGTGLLATRIEPVAPAGAEALVTGTVGALDLAARSFRVGSLRVRYAAGALPPGISALTVGQEVRINGLLDASDDLVASRIEPTQPVTTPVETLLSLSGNVESVSASGFALRGYQVDTRSAQVIAGGLLESGARVEVAGLLQGDVLRATRVRVRTPSGKLPGSGADTAPGGGITPGGGFPGRDGLPTFSATGPVAAFRSDADFQVQSQAVDASRAQTEFVNGSRSDLRNGRRVQVTGSQVLEDVLIADRVVFD